MSELTTFNHGQVIKFRVDRIESPNNKLHEETKEKAAESEQAVLELNEKLTNSEQMKIALSKHLTTINPGRICMTSAEWKPRR